MNNFVMLMNSLSQFGRSTPKDKAVIDNFIDQLHYRVTCTTLFGISMAITAADITSDMITCVSDYKSPYFVNSYCSYNSYTIPRCHISRYGGNSGSNCLYSGVGIYEGKEKIYHSSYKWAPLLILFQAISFYAPHRLWKNFESGKVYELTKYLRGDVMDPEVFDEQKKRVSNLAGRIYKEPYRYRFLYTGYMICQLLGVVNILANVYFIHWYLNGAFFKYGWESLNLLKSNPYDLSNPMHEVFPFMTKCNFLDYGSTGTPRRYDAMCQLPWNPLHEKFFIVLWCWLIILFLLSSLNFVWRLAELFLPVLRRFHLRRLLPPTKTTSPSWNSPVHVVLKRLSVSSYFLVHMLGLNMDAFLFQCLIKELNRMINPDSLVHDSLEPEIEIS